MSAADTYKSYAAECVKLAQGRHDSQEKATLLEMAAMWLRLAEYVEKHEGDPGTQTEA
jgi:hypothetical protein